MKSVSKRCSHNDIYQYFLISRNVLINVIIKTQYIYIYIYIYIYSHFKYLENQLPKIDATWSTIRKDFIPCAFLQPYCHWQDVKQDQIFKQCKADLNSEYLPLDQFLCQA